MAGFRITGEEVAGTAVGEGNPPEIDHCGDSAITGEPSHRFDRLSCVVRGDVDSRTQTVPEDAARVEPERSDGRLDPVFHCQPARGKAGSIVRPADAFHFRWLVPLA